MARKNYTIEHMTAKELQTAINWAEQEGWNPGRNDSSCFYQADPNGFFCGRLNGKVIAVGSAVAYDEQFAFCGFYIVDKPYRGQGYGLELTKARLNYVDGRNAGIDGVMDMLDKYKRLGYQIAHTNARYECLNHYPDIHHPHLVAGNQLEFIQLNQYDRRHFPAARSDFIRCWISQPGGQCFGYIDDASLKGYGVIRPCIQGYKIGPLFADSSEIADILYRKLASFAQGQPIYLDIPENNANAVKLVHEHHMNKVFATARMYLKGQPDMDLHHVYGITTFELG